MSYTEALAELVLGHPFKVGMVALGLVYLLYATIIKPIVERSSWLEPNWTELATLDGYEVYLRKVYEGEARYWMKIGPLNVQIEVELEECGKNFKPRAIAGTEEKVDPNELVSVFKIKEEN